MSTGNHPGPEHPQRTRRSGHRYFFSIKHHKNGPSDDAQWLPDLSDEDEFDVFDMADFHELSNDTGDLFGLLVRSDRSIEVIGSRGEQVAEFPVTPPNQPWHGYPLWPITRHGEGGRKARPSSLALEKMQDAGILSGKQKSRLARGKTI